MAKSAYLSVQAILTQGDWSKGDSVWKKSYHKKIDKTEKSSPVTTQHKTTLSKAVKIYQQPNNMHFLLAAWLPMANFGPILSGKPH